MILSGSVHSGLSKQKKMSDYFSKAAAFAQNAAKLSKKVSEGLVENAREFGLEATSSGHYFDTSEEKMRDIKRQLDSRHDREKMDGLKRLIAVCKEKATRLIHLI